MPVTPDGSVCVVQVDPPLVVPMRAAESELVPPPPRRRL